MSDGFHALDVSERFTKAMGCNTGRSFASDSVEFSGGSKATCKRVGLRFQHEL